MIMITCIFFHHIKKYKMDCCTCKFPYSYFQDCVFLAVRSHIQTHEQNILIGRQTESGKMMVLGTQLTKKRCVNVLFTLRERFILTFRNSFFAIKFLGS